MTDWTSEYITLIEDCQKRSARLTDWHMDQSNRKRITAMFERHRFMTDPADFRKGGEPLLDWWPDATEVETTTRESIVFTDRFPCPKWWNKP